ncbi:unnamed protein product [Soboliphyme baturini]|uniref:Exocyst complex component Sec10 n=1 Tax=Soboliphyme baturini TaxID=241478 RepID=A0A183J1I3_9BILA|nr:unnamed protein product [Soboliphyme baturini]
MRCRFTAVGVKLEGDESVRNLLKISCASFVYSVAFTDYTSLYVFEVCLRNNDQTSMPSNVCSSLSTQMRKSLVTVSPTGNKSSAVHAPPGQPVTVSEVGSRSVGDRLFEVCREYVLASFYVLIFTLCVERVSCSTLILPVFALVIELRSCFGTGERFRFRCYVEMARLNSGIRAGSKFQFPESANSPRDPGAEFRREIRNLQKHDGFLEKLNRFFEGEISESKERLNTVFAELRQQLDEREKTLRNALEKCHHDGNAFLQQRLRVSREFQKNADALSVRDMNEMCRNIRHFLTEQQLESQLRTATRLDCDPKPLLDSIACFGTVTGALQVLEPKQGAKVDDLVATGAAYENGMTTETDATAAENVAAPTKTINQVEIGGITMQSDSLNAEQLSSLTRQIQEALKLKVKSLRIWFASCCFHCLAIFRVSRKIFYPTCLVHPDCSPPVDAHRCPVDQTVLASDEVLVEGIHEAVHRSSIRLYAFSRALKIPPFP